ncbi:hypothetical protein NF865_01765 [Thermococcus aggregans]|uniref:Uncharacterized protein n=1 Tax=Thermococcus aggregans TaxID=110163 RepID=A0A9E7MY70_THEAG|nr:hypothetical protein [Thermococcus aggregans]USS40972.1 hypothetical protein NF865_01765 [Thermococcus aggregans]
MAVKLWIDASLKELKESGGFGAWIIMEVNGKRLVWASCYIKQALSGLLASIAYALDSCSAIPHVLGSFNEEDVNVILRNCRDKEFIESFGTYEPLVTVVFRKIGGHLLIESWENKKLVGREKVEIEEYVKAILEFLREYLEETDNEAYLTAFKRAEELARLKQVEIFPK